MSEINRRQLVKSAAWSLPVIALAVGAPAQAASVPPRAPVTCGGFYPGDQDNGLYTLDYESNSIIVSYRNVPDVYEINVRYSDGSSGQLIHSQDRSIGKTLVRVIPAPHTAADVVWVQVHSFNSHIGAECPIPAVR